MSRLQLNLLFVLFLTFFFSSCQKTEQPLHSSSDLIVVERYFNNNRTFRAKENLVVNYMRKKYTNNSDIVETIARVGYPRWDKLIYLNPSEENHADDSVTTFETIIVPYVKEGNYVNNVMILKVTPRDTILEKWLCDWKYPEVENNFSDYSDTAEHYAIFFMAVNKYVFGYDTFTILDTTLFNNPLQSAAYVELGGTVTEYFLPIEECEDVTIYFNDCQFPDDPACTPTCDQCWQCTGTLQYEYCWEEMIFGPGGGGGIGVGIPPNGEPIGGGGGILPPVCTVNCSSGWGPRITTPIGEVYAEGDLEETNYDDEMAFWEGAVPNPNLLQLPSWASVYAAFPKYTNGNEMCGEEVYNLVGGAVRAMMPPSRNACAVRLSRALNYSGIVIPQLSDQTWQGADGKYYFLSAPKMNAWLIQTFGEPTYVYTYSQGGANGQNFPALLAGKKGIYTMQPNWPTQFGAQGHVTLYNQTTCIPHDCGGHINNGCYFGAEGGVHKIRLWILQ